MEAGLRWGLRLAFVVSLGVLLILSVGTGRKAEDRSLRFERSPLVIPGVMQRGKEYEFDAVVFNDSDKPARLIGAGDYCTGSCYSGRGVPADIPAVGKGVVRVHIQAGTLGNFSGDLAFYTDRASQPTITLHLQGTVQDQQSDDLTAHHAKP